MHMYAYAMGLGRCMVHSCILFRLTPKHRSLRANPNIFTFISARLKRTKMLKVPILHQTSRVRSTAELFVGETAGVQ